MRKRFFVIVAILVIGTFAMPSSAALIIPVNNTGILPGDPDPAKVQAAVKELKSLSKKEKHQRVREANKELKAFKSARKAGKEPSTNTLLLVILAILLQPLAVYLYEGEINNRFWISLLLTILFWLPGVIYALVLILGEQ